MIGGGHMHMYMNIQRCTYIFPYTCTHTYRHKIKLVQICNYKGGGKENKVDQRESVYFQSFCLR